MKERKQFRNFCLTLNNEKRTDEELLEYVKTIPYIKYAIFQRERGEKKGTEHIQMYLEFSMQRTFNDLKKIFPKAHIEQRLGTKEQARDYCRKEETRLEGHNPMEFGNFVAGGQRSDLEDIMKMVADDVPIKEIAEKYPLQYFRYAKTIDMWRQEFLRDKYSNKFRNLEVVYIYGSAGCGKTSDILNRYGYENVYRVFQYKNAFDTYNGQDVLILDEYRSNFDIELFLNIIDGYPMLLPSRYNDRVACYTKVFIISNIPLQKQYLYYQKSENETWKAILRRIHKIYNYDYSKEKWWTTDELHLILEKPSINADLPF